MTLVSCPICAGPVELTGERPACLIGHDFDADDVQRRLGEQAHRALWSAIRALEDSASGARWRLTLPDAPAHLPALVESATREATLLRDLMNSREEQSNTGDRPQKW
jgi:hypothetical protein